MHYMPVHAIHTSTCQIERGDASTLGVCTSPASTVAFLQALGDSGVSACRGLRSISVLTSLRHLNLSDTAITDHSICSLSRMRRLKYLNLSHSGASWTINLNSHG